MSQFHMDNLTKNVSYARLWHNNIAGRFEERNGKDIFKLLLIIGNAFYFILLTISILVAYYLGPAGYFVWQHAVSDLGSSAITPAPFLFDLTIISSGFVLVPVNFIIAKSISSEHKTLSKYGLIVGLIGTIGYIGVGVFSLDRAGPERLFHNISAGIAFGGLVTSIFLFSLGIIFSKSEVPKGLGFYGLIGPLIALVLFSILNQPIFEWILLFSVVGFTAPVNLNLVI